MAIFGNQWRDVIEWEEYRDDVIFWIWKNKEIKKGSRLVIKPGQDAVFLYNGRIEGVFRDEGSFEMSSDIVPFLSSLKGYKFGFNSGLRAEVMFINTKEFTVQWGTKSAVNIPTPQLTGGLPIRAFGNFVLKVSDYITLIDRIAGVRRQFTVEDVRDRVIASLDTLLMKWIPAVGKDLFNLQANALEIASGIRGDLDAEMAKIGLNIVDFKVSSFNYPPEIQKRIERSAAVSMVDDVDKYTRVGMADAAMDGRGGASDTMSAAVGMAMGMDMAKKLTEDKKRFCPSCGASAAADAKFCASCGGKL